VVAGAVTPLGAAIPAPSAYPKVKKKMHWALKIALGVVGFIVLAFVGLLVLGMVLNHKAQVAQTQAAPAATSSTPASTAPAASTSATTSGTTISAGDLGLPLYPGSTLDPSGMSIIVNGATRVVQATLWTSDSPSTVAGYYQNQLGNQVSVLGLGDETILSAGSGNNTVTMMMNSENGKTKMNVVHTMPSGN
jgi:cytoskeletal protein RodZ